VTATISSGALARAATVGVTACVAFVGTAEASSASVASDGTTTALDSSSTASGFLVLGMPVATTVWLLAGVLAVLIGLVGASRGARASMSTPGRLLTAGVDDAAFGSAGRATAGDPEGDRS